MAYQFPLNGGRINATIGGNTAGVGSLVSTGTLTLAGGNNVTLSQNGGNVITIHGAAGGGGSVNFSAGTTSNNLAAVTFANGNGVSFGLNGSTITASHNALTSQSNQALSGSNGSFTYQTGTFGNSNGLSFYTTNGSMVGSYTVPTQSVQTQNMVSVQGSTGDISFANGNGVTFGGNNSTLTASVNTSYAASNHSHGNPTLALTNLSGTTASASNGLTLSLSAAAPGGGGGIALSGGGTSYSNGTVNLSNHGGALTISGSTNSVLSISVPQTSSLSATGAVSISTNGSTIFIGADNGASTMNFWQNMDRGTSASLATAHGTLMLQRLNQENNLLAANLTANTLLVNMTANMTATSLSSAHTVTAMIGVYSDNVTNISLLNSASTSWDLAANTSNTANYHGPRWLSFVSSQWSSVPGFSAGGEYVFGLLFRTSSYGPPMSYIGQNYMHSLQRSGSIGTTVATNTSLAQGNYWNAMFTAATAGLPSVISSNQVNRNNATAIFMPHIILNNRYSGTY